MPNSQKRIRKIKTLSEEGVLSWWWTLGCREGFPFTVTCKKTPAAQRFSFILSRHASALCSNNFLCRAYNSSHIKTTLGPQFLLLTVVNVFIRYPQSAYLSLIPIIGHKLNHRTSHSSNYTHTHLRTHTLRYIHFTHTLLCTKAT